MVTFSRYVNQEEHVWYDSSNIIYTKCYDTKDSLIKTLKVVFKGGRTYVYHVDANEYLQFKMSQSSGKAFNELIKKYDAVRIADTNIDDLNKLQETFKEELKENDEQKVGDLIYTIKVNETNGEFIITLGDRTLFRGIEGNFSVLNLLTSLNLKFKMEKVEDLPNDSDEEKEEIIVDINKSKQN